MRLAAIRGIIVAVMLCSTATVAAQTDIVATVPGVIVNSDGSRILYIPTGVSNELRIRAADGTETVIRLDPQYVTRPFSGYLTPTGAVFAAYDPDGIGDALFNFNAAGLTMV